MRIRCLLILNVFFFYILSFCFADCYADSQLKKDLDVLNSKIVVGPASGPASAAANSSCEEVGSLQSRLDIIRKSEKVTCDFLLEEERSEFLDFFQIDGMTLINNTKGPIMNPSTLPETIPFNQETTLNLSENPDLRITEYKRNILFHGYHYPKRNLALEESKRFFTKGRVRQGNRKEIADHIGNDKDKMMKSAYHQTTESLYTASYFSGSSKELGYEKSNGGILFIDPKNLENSILSVNKIGNATTQVTANAEKEILIYKVIPNKNFVAYYDRGTKKLILNCFRCKLGDILLPESLIYQIVEKSFNCSNFENQSKIFAALGIKGFSERVKINDDFVKMIIRKLFKEAVKF